MKTWTIEELEQWIDRPVIDRDGHRLGAVVDVYVDDCNGKPEWLAVMTGLFGSRISFVPIAGADEHGDRIQVAFERSLVKDSPNIDADGRMDEEQEARLYRHYGLRYSSPDLASDELDESAAEGEKQATRLVPSVAAAKTVSPSGSIDLRGEATDGKAGVLIDETSEKGAGK